MGKPFEYGHYCCFIMNNPQIEDGYMVLATGGKDNDIMSALISADLTAVEYQVVFLIIRKTYGYGKKEDWIAPSQFLKLIGRTIQGINKGIRSLEEKGIIGKRIQDGKAVYSFNKSFHKWSIDKDTLRNKRFQKGNKSFPDRKQVFPSLETHVSSTKETSTKETITKEIVPKGTNGKAEKRQDIDEVIDTMKKVLSLPVLDRSEKMNRYASKRLIDKMVKLCAGDHEKAMRNIKGAIDVASRDPFWSAKLTSVLSLERNIMQIVRGAISDQKTKSSSHLSL